jgi:ABC-2 type transport system permease protein
MKLHRINAIILHHIYFWKLSLPRWLDILYWPIVSLAVWGFVTNFIQGREAEAPIAIAGFFLGGIILWMLFQRAQQDVAISYLQDIWSRSIVNLYVSPLTNAEFIIASIVVGLIKIGITLVIMALVAVLLYSFNIFSAGLALVPFIGLLLIFGWAVGLFVTGIIFRYGTEAQVLAFGITFVLQPIAAVFYPLSVLPNWIQPIALAMPITHVFEGMRAVLATGAVPIESLAWSLGLNIIFFIFGAWFFGRMFAHVKAKGMLAKLE